MPLFCVSLGTILVMQRLRHEHVRSCEIKVDEYCGHTFEEENEAQLSASQCVLFVCMLIWLDSIGHVAGMGL